MKTTKVSLWTVALVAVMAMALGSFGSAAATDLSKRVVKQIAARVVTKLAPTLSVEHARTAAHASDADRLDGLDSTDVLPGAILPRGTTIRGTYNTIGRAEGSVHEVAADSISFGYRLASAPVVEYVTNGATATTHCQGTVAMPQAAIGYLCIYEVNAQNKRDPSWPIVSFGFWGDTATPMGAGIETQSCVCAGFYWSRGSWAVTAP